MEQLKNAKSCLSHEWGNVNANVTETGNSSGICLSVWDGLSCWAPTPAGSTVSLSCPSFKGSDVTKSAFRTCSKSGEWLGRDGNPSSLGWTNYTQCLTPEIREIIRRLGSDDDAQTKFNIAANTRKLEFVGLSLSLGALLLSLLIFYYFRTLRNSRTRIHRHLFIAMVIQVGIRLIVYTDQAITRSFENSSAGNISSSANLSTTVNETDPTYEKGAYQYRQGIDNTPILCEASYICLEYARTAMFMWMFMEGLFLHNMVTVTIFEEKLSPFVYPVVGWLVPIPLTFAWALVTHLHYGSATCWWGYNFTLYFWILEGPRLAVLVVNMGFLLNILRVLIMKLRQSTSSDIQQALKAVKAALVLLPLLGLTNLLNMLDAPLEKSPLQFALWSYSTHLLTSAQGFILALLYCFKNGEVQSVVRKFVRVRLIGRSKHYIVTKKPIVLSALGNLSFSNNYSVASEDRSGYHTVKIVNTFPLTVSLTRNGHHNANPNQSFSSVQNNPYPKLKKFSPPASSTTGGDQYFAQILPSSEYSQVPNLPQPMPTKPCNKYPLKTSWNPVNHCVVSRDSCCPTDNQTEEPALVKKQQQQRKSIDLQCENKATDNYPIMHAMQKEADKWVNRNCTGISGSSSWSCSDGASFFAILPQLTALRSKSYSDQYQHATLASANFCCRSYCQCSSSCNINKLEKQEKAAQEWKQEK